MRIISGDCISFRPDILARLRRYRYQVFVQRLGWPLSCKDGLEYDQYDRDDTVYVIVQNEACEIIGAARLLPTTQPYLLREIFPQLLHGVRAPNSIDSWELSRFAAVDLGAQTRGRNGQFSSPVATVLLRAALECAAARGAHQVVTVSPIGIERLLKREGFVIRRMASPVLVDGVPLFACSIQV